MKKLPQAALVGAGSVSEGPLGKLPGLPKYLGPVKAGSLRVASRFVNTLRAGRPVNAFEDLEPCGLVFLCVPDETVPSVIEAMAASTLTWPGRLVVLCSNFLGLETLSPLEAAGATTASFGLMPGFEDWFLIEGERAVERILRPMMAPRAKATLVAAGEKLLCVQSLTRLSNGFTPLIRETAETLRGLSVAPAEIERILDRQVDRMLRTYFRSGKFVKEPT
jgi:hypothetical protein